MLSDPKTVMIDEKGTWPRAVCKKGVGNNSILCTRCQKWVHNGCSGVKGSLTRVSTSFVCKHARVD